MTDEQKKSIIDYYNHARDDFNRELDLMDRASDDEHEAIKQGDTKKQRKAHIRYDKHDGLSSFASGLLCAIDSMLNIIGYEIVINDEDYAIDIEKN